MINSKRLLLVLALSLPLTVLADDAGIQESTIEGMQHEKFHESQHIGNKTKHNKGSHAFAKADKDSDGTLTKEEAKTLPHIGKHFDEIDTDKDGTVDRDEVHTYMKEHKNK